MQARYDEDIFQDLEWKKIKDELPPEFMPVLFFAPEAKDDDSDGMLQNDLPRWDLRIAVLGLVNEFYGTSSLV